VNYARLLFPLPLALVPTQCAPSAAHALAPPPLQEGAGVEVAVSDSGTGASHQFVVRAPLRERGETLLVTNDGAASYRVNLFLESEKVMRLKLERSEPDGRSLKIEESLPYQPGEKRLAARFQRKDGSSTEVSVLSR
jgi:hypothetical protein